jgi:hypothetical protein
MTGDPVQSRTALRRLINGFQISQSIYVAVTLRIPDLLAEGPRANDDLAVATSTHAPSLYRLLRALAALELLHEGANQHFSLAPLGHRFRSDLPESLAGWAAFIGEPSYWNSWGNLLHSVKTGENAFRHIYEVDPWTFRARDPRLSDIFDQAMSANAREVISSVLAEYDFSSFATIVDIGGGNGTLLAAILAKNQGVHGILFDQPHVVAGAPPVLTQTGVADRCQIVGGSFFEEVPTGGDAYILKAILHDWEDEECLAILGVCQQAMATGTTILVIEFELGPANERPIAKLSDLNMLVSPGGRERSDDEYAALFAATGFRYVSTTPTSSGIGVFAGIAV